MWEGDDCEVVHDRRRHLDDKIKVIGGRACGMQGTRAPPGELLVTSTFAVSEFGGDPGPPSTSLTNFDISSLASLQQAVETTNGLSPDPCRKVLGTELISTRGRALWLPHGLTENPDLGHLLRLRDRDNNRRGRSGASDTQSFIQPLGGLLTRG